MIPWIFTYFNSWIQALIDNKRAMNSVWCIAMQEFAVFTISAFIEAVEFGIERHETNDPGVCLDRNMTRGILLEVPGRIRACFDPDQFVQLLHERGVDIEWVLHAYIQSNSIVSVVVEILVVLVRTCIIVGSQVLLLVSSCVVRSCLFLARIIGPWGSK